MLPTLRLPHRSSGLRVAALLAVVVALAAPSGADEVNANSRIAMVAGEVEIELFSTKPFPVTSARAVLYIGSRKCLRSRYPADGNLNTLIFLVDPSEFEEMKTGDSMQVRYGGGESSRLQWDFGVLDKSSLVPE